VNWGFESHFYLTEPTSNIQSDLHTSSSVPCIGSYLCFVVGTFVIHTDTARFSAKSGGGESRVKHLKRGRHQTIDDVW
jgi:hypothetical protein